jgi:hypothetical protein
MSDITLNSIADYKETFQQIKLKVTELTEEQLKWKPSKERWSIQEVVAHLVDASLIHSIRIRKILAEVNAPFILYNQDSWVSQTKSNEADIADSLIAFEAILTYNVLLYSRISEEDWHKKTIHDGKEFSITDLFQGFIRHVQIHLAQINRNLKEHKA